LATSANGTIVTSTMTTTAMLLESVASTAAQSGTGRSPFYWVCGSYNPATSTIVSDYGRKSFTVALTGGNYRVTPSGGAHRIWGQIVLLILTIR
jgi:hypothetical protein